MRAKTGPKGGFLLNNMAITLEGDLLLMHDLNPEVRIRNRISRGGLVKLAWWCLRKALRAA